MPGTEPALSGAEHARELLKRAVKLAAAGAGALTPRRHPRTVVLTYHSVGARPHAMNVAPEAFTGQMRWLADHVPVIPLEAAARGEPGVALTFDDGYADNLRNAAPVLARHAFPATVYMVAGHPGGRLPHDLDHPDARLMTWEELRELRAAGIAVGSHTLTHRRLAALPLEEQRREVSESKAMLEDALGEPVAAFAYPFGSALDYTRETVELVANAGYRTAVSNRYGTPDTKDTPFELKRIWVDRTDSLRTFAWKVRGLLDLLAVLDSRNGIQLRRWLNQKLLGRVP